MALSTVCELFKANEPSAPQTPVSVADGGSVYIPAHGRTMIIGFTPTATSTVTVSAGDGVAAMNDLTFSAAANKVTFIQLDTSSFEFVDPDGAEKLNLGSIKITASKGGTIVAVNAL